MTVAEQGHPVFRRGLFWGLVVSLTLGVPAGVALKVAGYPTDELFLWMAVLGVALAVTLVASALVAQRRRALAGGLAVGATVGMPLAPLLVVVDIVAHSA